MPNRIKGVRRPETAICTFEVILHDVKKEYAENDKKEKVLSNISYLIPDTNSRIPVYSYTLENFR